MSASAITADASSDLARDIIPYIFMHMMYFLGCPRLLVQLCTRETGLYCVLAPSLAVYRLEKIFNKEICDHCENASGSRIARIAWQATTAWNQVVNGANQHRARFPFVVPENL